MKVPFRAKSIVSFGGCNSLKMRYARREREKERERRRKRDGIRVGGTNRCPRKSGCPEPGCRRVNIISPLYEGYGARYVSRDGVYGCIYTHTHALIEQNVWRAA